MNSRATLIRALAVLSMGVYSFVTPPSAVAAPAPDACIFCVYDQFACENAASYCLQNCYGSKGYQCFPAAGNCPPGDYATVIVCGLY